MVQWARALRWRALSTLAAVAACAIVSLALYRGPGGSARGPGPALWDPEAGKEVERALLQLHKYWNTMDVPALQHAIIGDDKLVTFDLDPDTYEPIRLASQADMAMFTDRIFQQFKSARIKTVADHPSVACRATERLGICTEECKVELYLPDGTKQVQHLRGTAIAIRQRGEWKWIQWHMSSGGAVDTIRAEPHG